MNILVLMGSPRKNGNTAALVEAFRQGAEQAGHEVNVQNVGSMHIGGCMACEYCHTTGAGQCIQKDDMQSLYPLMARSDMVVLASAVHYWGFTGQMQSTITRFYAPGKPAAQKYALVLSSGSPGVYDGILSQYHDILSYFGAEDMGVFTFFGDEQKTEENFQTMRDFGANL